MLDYSDLTYYKEGGNIFAGGYKVTDIVKYQGHTPPYDINLESLDHQSGGGREGEGEGGKSMTNLGVPSGLFYLAQRVHPTQVPFASHEMIPDDLYDNLLQLVKMDTNAKTNKTNKTKSQTKKTNTSKNNKKKSKKRT